MMISGALETCLRQNIHLEHTMLIDGWGPLPTIRPTTTTELAEHVRRAAATEQALYPFGGATMLDTGLPLSKPGHALDLRGLDQIIDYPARDMTITVQAGITIANLQALLATEKQQLPVDIPFPDQATLGGALATNASGPRRFGFGTLRDYLLGISVMNDEGNEVKAGGRVVKNVAGYDMMKLFTGSFGTLGIITQATLKVPPKPEASSVVLVACPADQLEHALLNLLPTTRTRPVCLSVMNQVAALSGFNNAPYILALGFEGQTTTVDWQVAQLRNELPTTWDIAIYHAEAAANIFTHMTNLPYAPEQSLTFKANILPAKVPWFVNQASLLETLPRLVAHAGNGIVYGAFPFGLGLDEATLMVQNLSRWASEASGNLVLPRCPTEWKAVLPVWGKTAGDLAVMRAIKAKLDPRGVFNPGRFVGGI
jgi:glycolate oxidase FAD binding subunit